MPRLDPTARLVKTAPYLDFRVVVVEAGRERGTGPHRNDAIDHPNHLYRQVGRGRRNNSDPVSFIDGWDFRPYDWAGENRAEERAWLDNLFKEGDGELNEQPHRPHTCLSCSCTIEGDEPEIRVPGKTGSSARYSHASWQECQAAMERARKAFRASFPGGHRHGGVPGHARAKPVASSYPSRSKAGGILDSPATPGDNMNKDILAIVRGFRDKGYTVEQSTGTSHFFVRNPNGSLYTTLPSTPHARSVTEAQNLMRRAPDLKAEQRAQRKLTAAAALGEPAPAEAPAPAERIAELPELREGKLPLTAWWLWDHLREEAERGGNHAQYRGKDGWMWTGHVSAMILRLWPKLADNTLHREAAITLGEYLRLTGHVVNVRNRGPNAKSEYWLAAVWAGGPDTVGKARTLARGAQPAGSVHDRNIAAVQEAVTKLADAHGTVTTAQVVAELPDINSNAISTLLGEVAASKFPLSRVKKGAYKFMGEPHMTETHTPRRSGLRLEVLHYKQDRPDVPESVADVAAALKAAESSVGRALREWYLDGTQGIDRITGNLYVFRRHLLPESHPLREAKPEKEEIETEAPSKVAPKVTPPAAPVPQEAAPAEGRKRIEDFIALRPDAKLYAEMFTTADGVTIVIDEDGQMRELRPKS